MDPKHRGNKGAVYFLPYISGKTLGCFSVDPSYCQVSYTRPAINILQKKGPDFIITKKISSHSDYVKCCQMIIYGKIVMCK